MKTLVEKLKNYNRWRRGCESIPHPAPKEVGEMIDQAIEALEAYERATQLAEVSNESPEALNEWIEASNDATTKVLTALRAIRGEESA